MLFTSSAFAVLLAVTFVLYHVVPTGVRRWILLAASCVFIGYNSLYFLAVAAAVSTATYFAGFLLKQDRKHLGAVYAVSVAVLAGTWMFFRRDGILFPIGISFYTFQAISYLTEIYWGEMKAEKDYCSFMLYMLLFMKFLSGPVERPGDLIPQMKEGKRFDYATVRYGLLLIMLGMVKKLVLADNLAPYTGPLFASWDEASGLQLLTAMLVYPVELYADFSGYTDMAVGMAMLFGIRLSPNFDRPFTAVSTADFWRRWHMSLSFWVRDYVFAPLTAFLRDWGRFGISLSLFVTFIVLGIWHGAGWNFVVYGAIQGAVICIEMSSQKFRSSLTDRLGRHLADALFRIRTYLVFAVSLVFFKCATLSDAVSFLGRLSFVPATDWKEMNMGMSDHICAVTGAALIVVLVYEHFNSKGDLFEKLFRLPFWARWAIYYILVFALVMTGRFGSDGFVYLQF